jgi:hypothetical protein
MNEYLSTSLNNIRQGLVEWLDEMAKDLEPGRFRFCSKGSFVPINSKKGQVSTCFAMKAAWQSGIWEEWPEERKQGCIQFIRSFQKEDGFFHDQWLDENAKLNWKSIASLILGRVSRKTMQEQRIMNLRAETRQSVATLLMVGIQPRYPLPLEALSTTEVYRYLDSFDWAQPWSAGSHLGHLLFFLTVNRKYFGIPNNYNELIDASLAFLHDLRNPETGCWFRGNPPDIIKINGAMKVLAGLQWVDQPYPDCTRLLDFALRQPFQADGCGFLNRLYVVHQALKGVSTKYRLQEVKVLGMQALEAVKRFRKPDGGFSFFEKHSQTNYYGARVSKGFQISDLHGTSMFIWAIAIILDLLEQDAVVTAENWRVQRA